MCLEASVYDQSYQMQRSEGHIKCACTMLPTFSFEYLAGGGGMPTNVAELKGSQFEANDIESKHCAYKL